MIRNLSDLRNIDTEELVNMSDEELKKSITAAYKAANRVFRQVKSWSPYNSYEHVQLELRISDQSSLTRYKGDDRDRIIASIQELQRFVNNPYTKKREAIRLESRWREIEELTGRDMTGIIRSSSAWFDIAIALGYDYGDAALINSMIESNGNDRSGYLTDLIEGLERRTARNREYGIG